MHLVFGQPGGWRAGHEFFRELLWVGGCCGLLYIFVLNSCQSLELPILCIHELQDSLFIKQKCTSGVHQDTLFRKWLRYGNKLRYHALCREGRNWKWLEATGGLRWVCVWHCVRVCMHRLMGKIHWKDYPEFHLFFQQYEILEFATPKLQNFSHISCQRS